MSTASTNTADRENAVRRLRSILVLSGALIAAALVAPPAGAFEEGVNSGMTGDYQVTDTEFSPGVVCRFESNPGTQNDELQRIKIKRLQSHGPFAQETWVGFRFLVKRNAPPFADGDFRTVFRSPIQKKRADDQEVAFFRGGWTAPEGATGQYRVHILLYYYAQGSQTQIVGRVRGLMEVYKHAMRSATPYDEGAEGSSGHCNRNFHGL